MSPDCGPLVVAHGRAAAEVVLRADDGAAVPAVLLCEILAGEIIVVRLYDDAGSLTDTRR